MTLSQDQHQQLLEMTQQRKPNWEISMWLSNTCGLSFGEAAQIRHQAIQELREKYEENRKQAEASVTRKEISSEESEAGEESSEQPERIQETPSDIEESSEERKEVCISCGNEDFSCACDVKRVGDIPF